MVVDGGIVGCGSGGGWTEGGILCCINKFILKSTKSLKDLRDDSRVFFIIKLVWNLVEE